MRIAYGIHGFGRGHAMRARAILPRLCARHDVLILAGGDAYHALSGDFDVTRIPYLKYYFNNRGKLSNYLTIKRNLSLMLEVRLRGPSFDMIANQIEEFGAQVLITDSEIFTHWIGRKLGIPRITFDHFGLLVYCRPEMPWYERVANWGNAFVYRRLYGQPDRAVVSGFFDAAPRRAGVKRVGAVIRDDVLKMTPTAGDHLLAYINKGEYEFTPAVEQALRAQDCPVFVYGVPRTGTDGNLTFKPISKQAFLDDLASCRAVYATCGNQLIGEVMHFGKPMLGTPMACHEQRLNAHQIERLGFGRRVPRGGISVELLRNFLADGEKLSAAAQGHKHDGASEALAAIEEFANELVTGDVPAPVALTMT
ncbi:MAG: hypothetical protein H6817_09815 [Phycisphaerales bacterium]|nr:hypothetical protein [Phycisphaerales bacterium]